MLDELISSQKPAKDKGGLGLEEGQSSKTNPSFNKMNNQRKFQGSAYQDKSRRINTERIPN